MVYYRRVQSLFMNVCIIGLGSMGRRRIRLLKRCRPETMIVGVDSDIKRVKNAAEEFGINTYLALEDIEEEMDCAFVCTSPQSHAEIIKDCLEKGMHIFSEINLLQDMYDENIDRAKKRGKILFLSSTSLYKAEMRIIDQKVKLVGKPCIYQYHVGQYLPDWHPWDDLKNFFISRKETNGCRELLAFELPWLQSTFGAIDRINVIKKKITDLDIKFSDTYLIQLEHDDGSTGNLLVDVVSRQPVRRLEILNEDLYIQWNGTPDSLYEKDNESEELKQLQADEYIHDEKYGAFINEYAYMKEIEDFFAVLNGKQPLYSFVQDKETLRIIDEIEGLI